MNFQLRHLAAACAASTGVVLLLAQTFSSALAPKSSYADTEGDAKPAAIDVTHTSLDVPTKSAVRIRVDSKELIRDTSDLLTLYLDTDAKDTGPEYVVYYVMGKNPAAQPGPPTIYRVDTWDGDSRSVSCGGLKAKANYRLDRVTVALPKKCLRKPAEMRWAGYLKRIDKADKKYIYGPVDYFPKKCTMPKFWVSVDGNQADF